VLGHPGPPPASERSSKQRARGPLIAARGRREVTKWRDLMCGDVRPEHVGRRLALAGWADARRDHGGLVFIDLRDKTGLCQLVVNPERALAAAEAAHAVRNEFVLRAEGEVVPRAPEAVNPNVATGEVELQVDRLEIVSRCPPLPFQLDEDGVDETTRLRYRWLDLRSPRMQRNLDLSARVIGAIRRHMDSLAFTDVWTPGLTKGTPEGARDFLVPVRLQPGTFFALAQSPQLFKQTLMVAGLDRYYQIATCWRDEDLRADRQFEFRQLDVELAFATRDDVFEVLEGAVVASFEALDREPPPRPFTRLPWSEAIARFGSDKPDARYGLEITDATDVTRGSQFAVFANAPAVRFLTVPQAFSRGDLGRLEEQAKAWGGKGLAYLVFDETGTVRSPIAKFLSERELEACRAEPGSTVLFAADEPAAVARVLGLLRTHLADALGLERQGDAFLWITDFPLFEWNQDEQRWTFSHHPFTGVLPEHEALLESDPARAISQAYDLVWNGWELGSGSIRIHRPEVLARVFRFLGLSDEEIATRFGFFFEVLRMGAPPHGGFALGIDRFLALLAGEANIREVIAFPKTASGSDPMTGAPTPIGDDQLRELGIALRNRP
jgi:aspartyl-tRNA synthetase